MKAGRWVRIVAAGVLAVAAVAAAAGAAPEQEKPPAWTEAHLKPPMTAQETRAFLMRLARYVHDHHLKTDANSPQRGMVYEYFQPARKGQFDQWIQGEGLDTMHDGAWYAAAMVNAFRATGEAYYKQMLVKWQLPFYCKMLNHSDELFLASSQRNDARPGSAPWGKAWAYQPGEKGFIPYFWDDGASVSLERREERNTDKLGIRPCVDFLAGRPNPQGRLNGYSQGMSNHMAQDLGVMVQQAWLLLRESSDPAERKLAAEVAEAARNLHECRLRHHGVIPMCVAPAALAAGSAEMMKRVPDPNDPRSFSPGRHYSNALYDYPAGERRATPGFADDQQYRYYHGIARAGGRLPRALAFKIVADAVTEAQLWRYYSDDAPVPAGTSKFDLYPLDFLDGKPQHYRSDRKGPHGLPVAIGSRMGPQNMICCGWALQVLRAMPGIWEEPYRRQFSKDLRVYVFDLSGRLSRYTGAQVVGKIPQPRFAPATLGGVEVSLASMPWGLLVRGTCKGPEATIRLFSRPDAKGTHAIVTVEADKAVAAVNDRGDALTIDGAVRRAGGGLKFSFALPYTVAKGQKPWVNGIEHGRYSIQVGKDTRNLYLASSEEDVRAWLEHELGGGLRTWEAILHEYGYVPTGIGTGRFWDGFSDSGGYAHLISAAAQWLLYLDGKSDWQVHRVPEVLPAP